MRVIERVWRVTFVALVCAALPARAGELNVDTTDSPAAVRVVAQRKAAALYVDPADVQPANLAVGLLAEDIQRVTGQMPRMTGQVSALSGDAVLVGTLGHSAVIDRLVTEGKLDVSKVRGQWEAYAIQVIDNPLPNVRRALVIVGSDRRGTAYGVVTVSQAIGVSPWYWWADVPVAKKSSLFVQTSGPVVDKPVVKYRGIFLNDEAPSLSGWAKERYGDLNHHFYVNVFELLLRLKANYLWPAMWNNCFNEDDPRNPELANTYGIVMGTSHVEPMMRADKEWNRLGYTQAQWNYEKSPEELRTFWKAGLQRNKPYDNVITIAMRGKIDTPMSETANIALLERIVTDQRRIIADVINPDVTQVPQLWALYKEVQEYYEKGMRVPDDVTLLWCDDNWGNVRRLPTPEERGRSGGAGIYYHLDYVGGPRNYKWLNTVPITKVWEQMNLAHTYGADRIWIVNVGDLKPLEFPMEFFLTMAWNPDRWTNRNLSEFGRAWATREFGPEHANEIAEIVARYTQYNGRRKPELLAPDTFSLTEYNEADKVLTEWKTIGDKAEAIYATLSPEAKDAFYQLVLYPTQASANLTAMYIAAGRNHLYASQGRTAANDQAALVRELFRHDRKLSDTYNHTIAGGKWNHMMDQTHIGYTGWQQPPENTMPKVEELSVSTAAAMGVAVEGSAQTWPGASEQAALPAFERWHHGARVIDIFDRGGTPFTFSTVPSDPWIVLSPPTGLVDKQSPVRVTIDWSKLPSADVDGSIRITGPGGDPVTVNVHATAGNVAGMSNAFLETDGCVSIEAEHFTTATPGQRASWQKIDDFGRTLSAMTLLPPTAPSVTPGQDAAHLEYAMALTHKGEVTVDAIVAPTLNFVPGRGLRYAIAFDDEAPRIVDVLEHNSPQDWEASVRDGVRHSRSQLTLSDVGLHTLKIWQVDPGLVLEKIVVDCGGLKPSYLGPPESPRHAVP